MSSKAATVEGYLEELLPERRKVISEIRDMMIKNLPEGYQENMNWGMICYEVSLSVLSDTYNGQSLMYAALAAQKNYYSVYLMNVYGDPKKEKELKESFERTGKKLNMGKSCLRFRKLEDIPMDIIGETVASTSMADYISSYRATRGNNK